MLPVALFVAVVYMVVACCLYFYQRRPSTLMLLTESSFLYHGDQILRRAGTEGSLGNDPKDYRALFGISPRSTADLWNRCRDSFPHGAEPKHLLWALLFLKTYSNENVLITLVGPVTRKTYRKWVWGIINAVALNVPAVVSDDDDVLTTMSIAVIIIIIVLPFSALIITADCHLLLVVLLIHILTLVDLKIRWENRFRHDRGRTCKATVDGTDFRIQQPHPFSKTWYSHKFRGPGLRYEVAVCIQTGDIVWINGPFKPGVWNDLMIFRRNLKARLGPGEKVETDAGYYDDVKVRTDSNIVSQADGRAKQNARSRHENVNRRLSQFSCLQQTFRHDLRKHKPVFGAVAVITQVAFESGSEPWQVRY